MSPEPGLTSWTDRTRAGVDPMVPRIYNVERVRRNNHDTFTLELNPVDGGRPEPFSAGQFNMLYVFGVGEIPVSISGDPVGDGPLTHTVREVGTCHPGHGAAQGGGLHRRPRTVRLALAARVGGGQRRGHRGRRHRPGSSAAGDPPGAGQSQSLRQDGPAVRRRAPREILYQRQLKTWGGSFDMDVHVTVDRGEKDWNGEIGVVTNLIRRAPLDRRGTIALICGPEVMMRFSALELLRRGMDKDRIFVSMERNMKCGVGLCGHCQYGAKIICKDGPVYRYDEIEPLLGKREI